MQRYENIITVGRKNGEWDFGVRATVSELDFKEMNELRSMLIVAIGTMERMWRDNKNNDQDMSCNIKPKNNG